MDGAVDIGEVVDVVLCPRQLLRILQEPLHLLLGATIAQLQVVQHRIVLLRKALVSVLDRLHTGAELVSVVGHVHHGHVCDNGGLGGITLQAVQQGCRETGDLLHVGV